MGFVKFFFFFSFFLFWGRDGRDRLEHMVLLKLRVVFFPRFSANCIAKMHFCIENCPLYILYLLYTMFIEIFLKL